MQGPGKQTSHAALQKSQVVSITSSIPISHTIPQLALGADMLNSPTFCLSHYLYHSALIAAIFNKQCIAFVYFLHYLFINKCSLTTCCTRTTRYGQNTLGAFSTPQYGVRSPNTFTSAAPRTYSIICIGSESCVWWVLACLAPVLATLCSALFG